jgi:ribosome-interacting GTPase 1
VAQLRTEKERMVQERTWAVEENQKTAQDQAVLRKQLAKISQELQTRNNELNSKYLWSVP